MVLRLFFLLYILLSSSILFSQTNIETKKDCQTSSSKGESEALKSHSAIRWFFEGLVYGAVLNVIGAGAAAIIAYNSSLQSLKAPENYDKDCFERGYSKKVIKNNMTGVIGGGVIGSMLSVIIIISVVNNSGYEEI